MKYVVNGATYFVKGEFRAIRSGIPGETLPTAKGVPETFFPTARSKKRSAVSGLTLQHGLYKAGKRMGLPPREKRAPAHHGPGLLLLKVGLRLHA